MKRFFACAAVILAANGALAQGVGINATGAAADTSAILDLASTSKGLLVPRMTTAQRAAIVLPATGLVIYQTDGTAGLYWNAGTSAVPAWKQVGEAGAGGGGQWTTSGLNIYYSAGNVAVGTTPGGFRFAVQDTGNVFRVQADSPNGVMASLGGFGQVQVDAPGIAGGRLALLNNGNLGLGVTNPTNKLSFAPTMGKKISLYPGTTGDVGFGVAGNRLQIYADNPNADVALGWDANGIFNERFAVKPNGALAVNGDMGAAGQVLQSNGSGAAATWVSPPVRTTVYHATGSTSIIDNGSGSSVPGLEYGVVTSVPSFIVVSFTVPMRNTSSSSSTTAEVGILIWGNLGMSYLYTLTGGARSVASGTHMIPVAAGMHLITIYGKVQSPQPGVEFGFSGSQWGSEIVLTVIPQ